jgi:hypothetical protein
MTLLDSGHGSGGDIKPKTEVSISNPEVKLEGEHGRYSSSH